MYLILILIYFITKRSDMTIELTYDFPKTPHLFFFFFLKPIFNEFENNENFRKKYFFIYLYSISTLINLMMNLKLQIKNVLQ